MEGSVGIVGYGFVGQAVYGSVREEHLGRVRVYDKYKKIHTAKDVLRCPIVYCCLPTVDGGTGEQDFSAYRDFFSLAIEEKYNGVLVVKSTVLYENLEPYLDKLNIVMNPEFLNQNNAIEDFRNQKVVILGGRIDHCRKVARCYFENFMMNENCEVEFCSVKEAVEIKYMHNIYHAYKVLFWNYVQEQTGNSRKISELYHKITERNELSRVCADGKKGYGGACLVSGTKILTKKGIKNIEEVVVGDLVWDGEKYTRVTKSGSRKVSKTIEIDSRGRKIRGSLDHIHLVWSQFDYYEKCEGFLEEKLLKDVSVDDWVFVPSVDIDDISISLGKSPSVRCRNWKEDQPIDGEFARLIGNYLAEGHSTYYPNKNMGEVWWSIGQKDSYIADSIEKKLVEEGFNPFRRSVESEGTFGVSKCERIRVRSIYLYSLFDKIGCGKVCYDKGLDITKIPNEHFLTLVGGWLDGDGSLDRSNVNGYSESTGLIHSIDTMLIFNGICSYITKKGRQINVSTKDEANKLLQYSLRLSRKKIAHKREKSNRSPNMRQVPGGFITKIKSVTIIEDEVEVFSLETESERYTANNILTHNCFPKDVNAFNKVRPDELTEFMRTYNLKLRGDEK